GFDVNTYVLTGKGDPAKALAGLYFWTWDTEEVLDMIQWMRRWNADPAHKKKVKFYGFDMQFPVVAARRALAFLHRVDPTGEKAAAQPLASVTDPYTADKLRQLPADRKQSLLKAATDLVSRFDEHHEQYVRHSSDSEWAVARQMARI